MERVVNNLKTFVLLAVLGGILVVVGDLLAGRGGATIGLILGLLIAGYSYWFSDRTALASAHAQPVSEAQAPELYRIIRELASADGIPMPRVYVTPEAQPNAFATGRNERHAAVAVTAGLLGTLNEEEVRGVLAHELSHVRNHDILIGSVAAAIAMGITFVARALMWTGGGTERRRSSVLGVLALAVLAPIAATIVQLAVSRTRETGADLSGAALIGTGRPLESALRKLDAAARAVPMNVDPAQATMYIINPLTGRRVSFAQLFSTHPPTAERIARLEAFDAAHAR